jgi:hypothetical protein
MDREVLTHFHCHPRMVHHIQLDLLYCVNAHGSRHASRLRGGTCHIRCWLRGFTDGLGGSL